MKLVSPRVLWIPRDGHRWFFINEPYPQLDSDEWIEYVPPLPDGLVEFDGHIWWRHFDRANERYLLTRMTT